MSKKKSGNLKLFTKRQKDDVENDERPKTATLDKPQIINVRLVGKIDMSLMKKEFLLSITNLYKPSFVRQNLTEVSPFFNDWSPITTNRKRTIARRKTYSSHKRKSSFSSDNSSSTPSLIVSPINSDISKKNVQTFYDKLKSPKLKSPKLKSPNPNLTPLLPIDLQKSTQKLFAISQKCTTKTNHRQSRQNRHETDLILTDIRSSDDDTKNKLQTSINVLSTTRSCNKNETIRTSINKKQDPNNNGYDHTSHNCQSRNSTKSVNLLPEPCRTCGRHDAPERLHSHPLNKQLKKQREKQINNALKMKSIVQKPVAIKYHKTDVKNKEIPQQQETPRSEKNKTSATSKLRKIDNVKKEKTKIDGKGIVVETNQLSKQLPPQLSKNSTTVKTVLNKIALENSRQVAKKMQRKETDNDQRKINAEPTRVIRSAKGSRLLTCYICGREFGTASLPLHEPKCLQKWKRENDELSPNLRRKMPEKPLKNLTRDEWNKYAWETSQANLIPCENCGRTFYPDRLIVHQRSCYKTTKTKDSSSSIGSMMKPASMSSASDKEKETNVNNRPASVQCKICGRLFGTRSIKIHEPQCLKKWHVENDCLPTTRRRPFAIEDGPSRVIDDVQLVDDQSEIRREPEAKHETERESIKKSPLFPCYLCGKQFSVNSIYIHEPQCLKKWRNENDKLPPNKRRQEPEKPDVKFTHDGKIDLDATNENQWLVHLSQLVPCNSCGRTFNPDRVLVHERSCKSH